MIIGHKGYLGNLVSEFISEFHKEIQILVPPQKFKKNDSESVYDSIIFDSKVDTILNCAGAIDGQDLTDYEDIISAHIDLPLYLYTISLRAKTISKNLRVVLISSTSKNSPRPKYPIYAACKSFENSLFLSAQEAFAKTSVEWSQITVPSLAGGLRHKLTFGKKIERVGKDDEYVRQIARVIVDSQTHNYEEIIDE